MKDGLIPQLGQRARSCKEYDAKLYLVKNPMFIIMINRFMRHPDFDDGYDIWRVLINKDDLEDDNMLQGGRYIKKTIRGTLHKKSCKR